MSFTRTSESGEQEMPPTNVFLILALALDSLGPGSTSGKKGKKNMWIEFVVCSLPCYETFFYG